MGVAVTVPSGATMLAPSADAATATATATPVTARKAAAVRTAPVQRVVVVSFGSRGELVRTVQERLGGLAVDGIFGPRTHASVLAFQQSRGLDVDGYVGPRTWEALGGYPGVSAAPAPSTCTVSTLRFGSSGANVKLAQEKLGGLIVDGIFGTLTRQKVRDLQEAKGLPVTGTIDAATWNALGAPCGVGSGGPVSRSDDRPTPAPAPVAGDPNAPYRMPFLKGTSYRVSQGPHGGFSHNSWNSKHAVDFTMPVGTPIIASRAGVVHRANWNAGGGNIVFIKDASGMCQAYLHLNSSMVTPGQPVVQGQRIGTSGNTGRSTGAHLHFGLVDCDSYASLATPNSVERGTSYPSGVVVTSQNG